MLMAGLLMVLAAPDWDSRHPHAKALPAAPVEEISPDTWRELLLPEREPGPVERVQISYRNDRPDRVTLYAAAETHRANICVRAAHRFYLTHEDGRIFAFGGKTSHELRYGGDCASEEQWARVSPLLDVEQAVSLVERLHVLQVEAATGDTAATFRCWDRSEQDKCDGSAATVFSNIDLSRLVFIGTTTRAGTFSARASDGDDELGWSLSGRMDLTPRASLFIDYGSPPPAAF
ncbi:hypothetical protein [Sphingomicrobium aestuariivivum]|uniref:hypothetical protein n=1 Tax=Sphingomicrobium aestuariivivum TaxID=1582356 RepID=UPI001FD66AC5|nr:hypothetical protein [Sphingomicrobium aestuariivivum]MCJ8190947.1 hypothetical protein [Sphingomicrobium aestuariivivum]